MLGIQRTTPFGVGGPTNIRYCFVSIGTEPDCISLFDIFRICLFDTCSCCSLRSADPGRHVCGLRELFF